MWTDEEINILKRDYGNIDIKDIPLNRSISAIKHKASRLGLYVDHSLIKRFFDKVLKTDSCWLWNSSGKRYGYIQNGYGSIERAHRISWKIHFGDIPDGLLVLHKCDNPLCVNPEHLFLGTQLDNMIDMKLKNRANGGGPLGDKNGQSKLDNDKVRQIRELKILGITNKEIARRFNISIRNVGMIVNNKTWKIIK